MYVLCKIYPRAETVDTLLYFVSEHRSNLEEILLSLYDEAVEIAANHPDPVNAVKNCMDSFQIVAVPFLAD